MKIIFASTHKLAIQYIEHICLLPFISFEGLLVKNKFIPYFKNYKNKIILYDNIHTYKDVDLIIVFSYGVIIPQPLLNIPKYGWINIHYSLLPKWRGASPIEYALLNGDTKSGVTIFKLDKGCDTGDIILQKSCLIEKNDNYNTLLDKLTYLAISLLEEVLWKFKYNTIEYNKQEGKILYSKLISFEDRKINFSNKTINIINQICAFKNGAFCYFNNKRVNIYPIVTENKLIKVQLGKIKINKFDKCITVGTIDGAINIFNLQIEGSKILSAIDFINGMHVKDGDYFI